jgi:hypothetical protein
MGKGTKLLMHWYTTMGPTRSELPTRNLTVERGDMLFFVGSRWSGLNLEGKAGEGRWV